jgi:hypothetical protein
MLDDFLHYMVVYHARGTFVPDLSTPKPQQTDTLNQTTTRDGGVEMVSRMSGCMTYDFWTRTPVLFQEEEASRRDITE